MSWEKFNGLKQGEYWKTFFAGEKDFYQGALEHLKRIHSGSEGADIGAGPGCAALLLHQLGVETTLYGLEPSDTHTEGIELAQQLANSGSTIRYIPVQADMSGMQGLGQLDYLIMFKALHEIALGVEDIQTELAGCIRSLKQGGLLFIGDIQYHPRTSDELIDSIRRIDEERIGHSHPRSEYIDQTQLQTILPSGLRVVQHSTLPNTAVDRRLGDEKPDFSPKEFYITTFEVL